ncbi:hypothetical protein SpCBS45565_g03884 [Spizellomyces sp. 'palustris']|nr:hypothetical protein SpCBS45565_g03884 [Spizellomyces sp. 'palustris']
MPLNPSTPSLAKFLSRQKALGLYRSILRLTRRTLQRKDLDPQDKRFIRDWARSDFERYRYEVDSEKISMLISQGVVQLRTLEKTGVGDVHVGYTGDGHGEIGASGRIGDGRVVSHYGEASKVKSSR